MRVTHVLHRRRLRREGGPERPVPRRAARARPPRRPVLVTLSRKESLRFHAKRHPMWLEYTAGCDEDGRLVAVRARIVGDTRRLRERRRQGARARGRPRLRRLPGAERRRRGEGRLHEQPALRRDARLRRQPVELRDRGRARPARRAGRDRRLGDPLAQRARGGRPLRHRPEARPRRRPEARRCSRSATPTATRATPGSPAA